MSSINVIAEKIRQDQVVAYPTEAVFGLGCNPHSRAAVMKLLALKQRPIEKGLILIAPSLALLRPYIDEAKMNGAAWQRLSEVGEQAVTWIVPASESVPKWVSGRFDSVAVRICPLPEVAQLCQQLGYALTSTSANLSGLEPCRNAAEVQAQFGADFPVLNAPTLGRSKPSEIRDIFSQQVFREG